MRDLSDEVLKLLGGEFDHKFWKHKTFTDYHAAQAEKKMKGSPLKAAELLGVSDTRKMKELMVAHAVGDEKKAKQMTSKMAAMPELKAKQVKPTMITRMLRKARLI